MIPFLFIYKVYEGDYLPKQKNFYNFKKKLKIYIEQINGL